MVRLRVVLALSTATVAGMLVVPLLSQGSSAAPTRSACGVERWAVKTLTDRDAKRVSPVGRRTSVLALRKLKPPARVRVLPRVKGVETTVWVVKALIVEMRGESDGDVHLVIAEPTKPAAKMIVEFAAATCTYGAAPVWRAKMQRAKRALLAACGAPGRSFTKLRGTATIGGVGFFDVLHGQRGVAPNAIELHPVVSFVSPDCRPAVAAKPPPPPPPPPVAPPPPSGNCASSYPDVCIPPPPPDLDCGDVSDTNIRVIYTVPDPDPHGFDGDRDGIGCEQ